MTAPEKLQPPFAKKAEVLAYLQQEEWDVKKTAFYDYLRDGLLMPNKRTGKYEQAAIDRFARRRLRRQETGQRIDDERASRQLRKEAAEIRKLEAQAAKAEHDREIQEGKFVPRSDVELEMAGRAVVLDSGLRTTLQSQAPAWIELVGGDQAKRPDLVEAMKAAVGALISDYVTAPWRVLFRAAPEDEPHNPNPGDPADQ